MMKKILLTLIKIYQLIPLYPSCRFYPSCSEYTYQAIDKFGVVRGSLMGGARIVRCNPLSKPGLDLVPDHFSMKRNEE